MVAALQRQLDELTARVSHQHGEAREASAALAAERKAHQATRKAAEGVLAAQQRQLDEVIAAAESEREQAAEQRRQALAQTSESAHADQRKVARTHSAVVEGMRRDAEALVAELETVTHRWV